MLKTASCSPVLHSAAVYDVWSAHQQPTMTSQVCEHTLGGKIQPSHSQIANISLEHPFTIIVTTVLDGPLFKMCQY